jgi:hypothetical protein
LKEEIMSKRYRWPVVLVVLALLVTACGPVTSTPAETEDAVVGGSPTEAAPTSETVGSGGSPVDSNDWRVLGSEKAAVTIVEYSDFQ